MGTNVPKRGTPKGYSDFTDDWEDAEDVMDIACCDCMLVHTFEFRIHKGRVQIRVNRNERSTAQLRRRHKPVVNPTKGPERGQKGVKKGTLRNKDGGKR